MNKESGTLTKRYEENTSEIMDNGIIEK